MARSDFNEDGIRVRRPQRGARGFDHERRAAVAERVTGLYRRDIEDRTQAVERRIQRYAKYRGWTEGKDWPWPDSSDIGLTDMMVHSDRTQDTLHNAIMSARPPVVATALNEGDRDKERNVDRLLDTQIFIEQGPSATGESALAELIEGFVNDGVFTAYVPWINEKRDIVDLRVFPPAGDINPRELFRRLVQETFPAATLIQMRTEEGWDWIAETPEEGRLEIAFWTREFDNDRIEMTIRREVETFNGPKLIPLDWDDVLHPPRAGNLQIPSPANPRGSAHVIVRSYPTVDEVKRLRRRGVYDLIDEEEMARIESAVRDAGIADEAAQQKDRLQGSRPGQPDADKTPDMVDHRTVTLLRCFDLYDIDDDGMAEDVVWWVIAETGTLCRARLLTEVHPSNPPMRPFAEASYLPVNGRRQGISLLEQIEGLHDALKQLIDQAVDNNTIINAPFFFYRATGATKNEVITMMPGEGYPLPDPQRDVNFPSWGRIGIADSLNLVTLLNGLQERTTMQSGLAFGQVPRGGASALRTVGGMSLVAGQGEARPERILRRFFGGLVEIYRLFHELNQYFLPERKKIILRRALRTGEDPYQQELRRGDVSGRFSFDFSANAFNSARAALQQSLMTMMSASINELTLMTGIMTPEGIYRFQRDLYHAFGLDPDRFINPPTVEATQIRLFATEAIGLIMDGGRPDGIPAEPGGAMQHLQELAQFMQGDEFGFLSSPQVDALREWIGKVQRQAQQEAIAAAAGRLAGQQGQGQPGRPAQGPPQQGQEAPMVQPGELIDETLPGAGGGANGGAV